MELRAKEKSVSSCVFWGAAPPQDVRLSGLEGTILKGTVLNLIGMGATLLGLQVSWLPAGGGQVWGLGRQCSRAWRGRVG